MFMFWIQRVYIYVLRKGYKFDKKQEIFVLLQYSVTVLLSPVYVDYKNMYTT